MKAEDLTSDWLVYPLSKEDSAAVEINIQTFVFAILHFKKKNLDSEYSGIKVHIK